jgi:hypothetical protein
MPDLPTIGWLFAVAGGALILGLAIAYGIMRGRKVTPREHASAERGARDIYKHERDA